MFDPKKVGEEADQMIASLNQPQDVIDSVTGDSQSVEDQTTNQDAISEKNIDTTQTSDKDVSDTSTSNAELALQELRKQVEAAEQRWKVLQGMIDKKDEELENMRMLLAQMQATSQGNQSKASDKSLITEKDIAEYGEDYIDLISRVATEVARKIAKEEIDKFKPVVEKVEQGVTTVQKTTDELAFERFISELTAKVPDWEQLNTDPKFLSWLNQIDEFVGTPRLAILRDAFAMYNVPRVAKFFNAFKEEIGLNKSNTQQKPDVKKFVAPGKSRATQSMSDSNDGKYWTRAEISKLYDDKMKGKISQSEFERMERDLFKAQREGRVMA